MSIKIQGFFFSDELYYDREHGWIRVEGGIATQGLSDFGQTIAGEIAFVEIPRTGREVEQGKPFMSIESGKWVGRLSALVSGKIVDVNKDLEWEPEAINSFPYDDGWIVKIEFHDPTELDNLMKAGTPEFEAFLREELEKYKDVLNG